MKIQTKSLNQNFIILFFFLIALVSCKKEEALNYNYNYNTASIDAIYYNGNQFPNSPYSFKLYLNNLNVTQEEKNIDNALFYIGKAISKMSQDIYMANFIKQSISDSDCVNLNSLLTNSEFRNELKLQLSSDSVDLDNLIENMFYKGDKYYPVIYFVNKSNLNIDLNKRPIIASGIAFDDVSIDSSSSYVFSWIGNNEVLINEEISNSTSSPILIVTNHTDAYKTENIIIEDESELPVIQNKENTTNTWKRLFTNSFRIDYRYETSKHSEYAYLSCINTREGFYEFGKGGYTLQLIHKRDIGKSINHLKHFTTQSIDFINNYLGMVIVTFEKDWYASKKPVLVKTPYKVLTAYCPMKFNQEYYQIAYINKNSSQKFIQKGFIVLFDQNQ